MPLHSLVFRKIFILKDCIVLLHLLNPDNILQSSNRSRNKLTIMYLTALLPSYTSVNQ